MSPSTAVVGVDGDILLGQVAGEHAVAAATEAERDLHPDFRLLHQRRHGGLVVAGIARALVGDADVAEPDGEAAAVGRLGWLDPRHGEAGPNWGSPGGYG